MSLLVRPEDRPIPEGCSLAGPLGDGIAPLAALWQETRSDEVARRLIDLSEAFASFFRKLPKKGRLFDQLVVKGEPRMLTILLRSVTHGSEMSATERLMRIWERYGIDPRIRHYLDRWRANANVKRVWKPYLGGLSFSTTLDLVRGEWAQREEQQAQSPAGAPLPWRAGENAKSFRPLADADRIVLGRADDLLASFPKRRVALGLLREVYTHPEDIPRRIVFSDALMDLGDPWGELIAIQCARKLGTSSTRPSDMARAREREEALLKAHRRTWLGRLAPWVLDDPPARFEAGFPTTLSLDPRAPAVGIREWGTVTSTFDEEARHPYARALFTLALLGRARAIKAAHLVVMPREQGMPRLRWRNASIERLTLRVTRSAPEERTRLLAEWSRSRGFPNLERIDLEGFGGNEIEGAIALTETPFGAKLTEIGLSTPLLTLLTRITPMLAVGRALPVLHSLYNRASVRFDPARRSLTLSLDRSVDLSAIGVQLANANLRELRVEASEIVWPTASTTPWRRALRAVTLDVVRAG